MAKYLDFNYVEGNTEDDLESKMQEAYDRDGLKGLNEHVTRELDRWKHEKITIAVTGNSGAGKSSLINALRGLDQDDENAAEEGVTETTQERKDFSFPSNEKIVLCDIPGAGTESHKIEQYTGEMNFKQYNFVVIVTAKRFTENDAVIIKELQRLKKPFFLVRSNIGYDVYNHRKTQKRDEVLDKIRKDLLSNLQKLGVHDIAVFLVDSHAHEDFELGKLQMSFVKNEPEEALKASLIFSYRNMTKEVIEEKIQHLKNRAKLVAVKAVASAATGAGYLLDVDVITDEINFYIKQLGLEDKTPDEICKILGVDLAEMGNMISFTDLSFQEKIIKIFSETDDKFDVKQICFRFLVGFMGSTLSAFIKSVGNVQNKLCKLLEILHLEALDICERIVETNRQ